MKTTILTTLLVLVLFAEGISQNDNKYRVSINVSYPFQLGVHNSIDKWNSYGHYYFKFSRKAINRLYIGIEGGVAIHDITYKTGILNSYLKNNPDMIFYDTKIAFSYETNTSKRVTINPNISFGLVKLLMREGGSSFATYDIKPCSSIGIDFIRTFWEDIHLEFSVRYELIFKDFNSYTWSWCFPPEVSNTGNNYMSNIGAGIGLGLDF